MMTTILEIKGTLRYGDNNRLAVEFSRDFGAYYRALMPKAWTCYGPRATTHLTVVRTGVEIPKNAAAWRKYSGKKVLVRYENYVRIEPIYYVLRAWSETVEEIRLELGLPRYRMHSWYHITIGHKKQQ